MKKYVLDEDGEKELTINERERLLKKYEVSE